MRTHAHPPCSCRRCMARSTRWPTEPGPFSPSTPPAPAPARLQVPKCLPRSDERRSRSRLRSRLHPDPQYFTRACLPCGQLSRVRLSPAAITRFDPFLCPFLYFLRGRDDTREGEALIKLTEAPTEDEGTQHRRGVRSAGVMARTVCVPLAVAAVAIMACSGVLPCASAHSAPKIKKDAPVGFSVRVGSTAIVPISPPPPTRAGRPPADEPARESRRAKGCDGQDTGVIAQQRADS